jgi:hypothetical protein
MEVAGLILFGVGALILFFGVGELRDAEKRLLARRLAAKDIRDAEPGELVKVRGRIAASERGPIVAPVTGQEAVWFRVIGSEDESTSGESSFRHFMAEAEWQPFVVTPEAPGAGAQDEAGVRVDLVGGVHIELAGANTTSSGPVTGVPERMQEFLDRKGIAAKTEHGFERRREFKEERLSPGDEVLVVGPKPAPPAPPSAAYRDAPGEPAAMTPVLVTMKSDAELAVVAAGGFSPTRAALAIGLTLAGALLLALSFFQGAV